MGVRIPPSGPFIGGILMMKICKHCNVGFDISNKPTGTTIIGRMGKLVNPSDLKSDASA